MSLADKLLARLGRPGGQFPDYIGARCLRRRFIRSGCDLCARECPAQAVYPGEGALRLDEQRCTGCLACTAVCPSEALLGRDSRPDQVRERICGGREKGPAVIGCERTLRTGRELLLPCLGLLSREELAVYAVLSGGLVLLVHSCHNCHTPDLPELLARRVEELADLWHGLNAYGPLNQQVDAHGERLAVAPAGQAATDPGGQPEPTLPPVQIPVIELCRDRNSPLAAGAAPTATSAADSAATPSPSPDRRDFFRAFKTVSLQAAAETWWAFKDEPRRQEEHWASSKHLPHRLQLLVSALGRVGREQRPLLLPLLTTVTVAESCTLCEACVGLCPSGALTSRENAGGRPELFFAWQRCSGCGLCREFCPAKAVELRRPSLAEVQHSEPLLVRANHDGISGRRHG